MKKILLATTMLTATAGIAAAEMTVTGSARMGVQSNFVDNYDADGVYVDTTVQAAFNSRFRINFTGSGTTDGGLTFGASARADQAGIGLSQDEDNNITAGGGANGDRWMNAGSVYLAGSFGTITMGDTGNAADSLVGQVSYVGYTSLNSWNEIGFLGKDTTGVQYAYSANGLTFAIGAGQTFDPAGSLDPDLATPGDDNFWSAAIKYGTDQYSVALGYEQNEDDSQISFLGSATFSGFTGKLKLADRETLDDMMWAISGDYTMNGVGLTAYYNADANDYGAAYGMGASYDLGGGASVVGGIAQHDEDGYGSIFDLGLLMSF